MALNGWWYKREIIINNFSNSNTLTNYQVLVVLDTASLISAGKMKPDGSDIRITDSDDNTLLNFWIEGINTSSTKIWVKVPSIPASSTKTIYLYYGNPSATSQSSIADTFIREISGVVGAWSLDEGTGTTVGDTSGNNNNGTISGATWTNSGKFNKALSFDGVNDKVIIPHSSSLNLNELTVTAWVKTTYSGGWFKTIVSKYGDTLITNSWGLGWIDTNILGFYIRDANNVKNQAIGGAGQGLNGNWHHVVGVAASTYIRFWIDGVLKQEVTRTAGDIRNDRFVSLAYHANDYVPVSIDEVLIFNRALSTVEITDLYNNYGYSTPAYPGKVLVRKFSSPEPTASVGNESLIILSGASFLFNLV